MPEAHGKRIRHYRGPALRMSGRLQLWQRSGFVTGS